MSDAAIASPPGPGEADPKYAHINPALLDDPAKRLYEQGLGLRKSA